MVNQPHKVAYVKRRLRLGIGTATGISARLIDQLTAFRTRSASIKALFQMAYRYTY